MNSWNIKIKFCNLRVGFSNFFFTVLLVNHINVWPYIPEAQMVDFNSPIKILISLKLIQKKIFKTIVTEVFCLWGIVYVK